MLCIQDFINNLLLKNIEIILLITFINNQYNYLSIICSYIPNNCWYPYKLSALVGSCIKSNTYCLLIKILYNRN